MVGIGRALKVLQVAGHTSRAGQVVVIIDVAIGAGAWWHGMQSGERESSAVVVKLRIRPVTGAMALLASLWEARSHVVGIGRALEVLQVAGHASRACQVVVIVNVAVGACAWWHGMQPSEREPGAVVFELRVRPVAGAMTLLAGLREVRSRVAGIGRALEVLQVAGDARRACQVVVVVDVTIGASSRRNSVQAGQREPRGIVIKRGIQPTAGGMTLLAGLREVRSRVAGIGRALEILQVTGDACRAV